MLFSSTIFVFLFLPMVLIFYYGIFRNSRKLKNIFLLLASLFFYAWGEPTFVLVMIMSIICNYYFGLQVDKYKNNKKKAKSVIVIMLIFNLTIMFIFKYLMFTLTNIKYLTGLKFNIPNIALPIGISFFTFQAISYVIDVYRGNGKVQKNPLNVGLYISFFPQLIAGPIVRYETIAEQIENRHENFEDFSKGTCRFIIGLGKKMLLANTLALVADYAFSVKSGELSVVMAWLGALAYTFQIFFDFSGYSDMAIGLGLMFGFKFLENFNYPYISKSISEFWRRWHISLGTWFRDYVYFPLGGSRVSSKKRLVFNLFVVWSLTGLWHGANWTFIVWGLMYFVLITLEKLTKFDQKLGWFGHIYTMLFVILGWVLFRADNISYGIGYIKSMFAMSGNMFMDSSAKLYFLENRYFYLGAILCSLPLKNIIGKKINLNSKVADGLYTVMTLLLFMISVSYIVKGSYNPFIYFNF